VACRSDRHESGVGGPAIPSFALDYRDAVPKPPMLLGFGVRLFLGVPVRKQQHIGNVGATHTGGAWLDEPDVTVPADPKTRKIRSRSVCASSGELWKGNCW
jgi:hypothetical protein